MGFLTIAQIIIDWCRIKIPHVIVLIVISILYLLSIIADIYFDRLALKKELNKLQQNNNGLQQNIEQLESDKKVLQSNLEISTLINHQLISVIPSDKIELVNQQIKLIEEIGNIGKTNQNSKNN